MSKSLFRLLVSCQILLLVIPNAPPTNPNTPEFVANRRKMLDLVLNDKCKKLNHLSREFKKVHFLHGFAKPRKFLRSLPQKREWFAAKSVANQACNETLLLFTKLPDEERTACDGAYQPMCRLFKEKGWVCSVLWDDELEPFPPKKHDFKYCAEKSLAVDEAYREKLEPEVGAGSSFGHQRQHSPGRGSKNSDTSSKNCDTSCRNSKRNRKNAEATNENAINGQESSRGSDDESEPLTKSSSLMTQYSEDSRNSQRSKSSSGTDSQRSTSSNGRDGQSSTGSNGRNSQRSTSSNNKSIQRSKGGKKEYIEAVKRAAIAANTVLLKPSIEKGGGAHGMKSKAEMAIDWVASSGKKLWDKGREDVLKTGKAWIENGGGAHRMKSKAGMVKDWVASLRRKFWDTSRKDVLKMGNRQEGSRSSDGEDKAPTKSYSLITQYSDDSSSSQGSKSSSGTNSQRSKGSKGRESQRSRSRKRESFEAERRAAAFAANGALVNAKVKKDEKADKMRSKQKKMVQDWMDSDGEKSWGTGGDGDLKTGNSHPDDVKSPFRDSPKNTPEFVANRRKMLDLVVFNDKCNELNYLSRTFETANRWHKLINPRRYRRAQTKLIEWNAALSVGDEACKEALYLWTTLPGDEMAKCPGAVAPMCQNYPETGWVCGVYWHDADRIDPPLEFPFKYCLQKSLEVDAAFRKEEGPDVGAGRSPGHQRRNSPSRGSKNSDMSGRNSERNRKNAEANRQESSRSSDSEEKAPTKSYSLITQYSDDSSSSQGSKSSSGTNSQRSKRSNGRESQRSKSRKRENFEAERRAVAVAAAAVAASGALDDARLKKDEKAEKMRNKQKMVQDWMDSNGEKSWGTGGDDVLKTGNSHQHDVKSPVRDSPRVRKRGRATSSPNSSPNRAFNGNSLNVKLNKHYPGDVSIEP